MQKKNVGKSMKLLEVDSGTVVAIAILIVVATSTVVALTTFWW